VDPEADIRTVQTWW